MTKFIIRTAKADDVQAIVELLADDILGAGRETASGNQLDAYVAAFAEIEADPNNDILVADTSGRVVGCLQLTVIPGLSISATKRGQIESVRVAADMRGTGLGEQLIEAAIDLARSRGCKLMQLTSNKVRADAIRFYEKLGFTATHEGFKKSLAED